MINSIIFALASYFGWGIGDVFGTAATRKVGPFITVLYFLLFQLVIWGFISPLFINDLAPLTISVLSLNLVLGIIGTIGMITFYESLRVSSASLAGTLSSSFAALTVILSIIFLKETVSLIQGISIIVIFIGIIISTLDFEELQNRRVLISKGVFLALITAILWGIYWAFIKIPVSKIGWFWPGIISLAISLPVILIFFKIRKLKITKPTINNALLPLIANAILLGIGAFSFNFAISKGQVAVVAPIAGSYPTLFAILAYFVFRDPIARREIFGIIITLIGIVLLSFFSV